MKQTPARKIISAIVTTGAALFLLGQSEGRLGKIFSVLFSIFLALLEFALSMALLFGLIALMELFI